ncbi:late embryogenesis abundant protein At1g64065-like [Syzygium oleosum]|uniref:late embryogenesis abundant protein At1g64065-like n=1 Tax=Syzygium oleosum TaxID=219896 RepID=UPI0024B9B00D|nr:late embryogenesis abundant protein At1g64065-like [Syzygium oleosum]
MADKTRNDAESLPTHEEKRKKRMKWAVYIAAFAVFQVAVILVFVLVVMKVRTPKFRVGDLQIQSLYTAQTPSFNATFLAPIRVKNNNFGPYKYDATTVNFICGGVHVGNVTIPKSKANFMSTKKIDLNVTLSSGALPSSANSTLSSGVLTLMSEATLSGKVEVMIIFKKKKSTKMNCTMEINVSAKTLTSVDCK